MGLALALAGRGIGRGGAAAARAAQRLLRLLRNAPHPHASASRQMVAWEAPAALCAGVVGGDLLLLPPPVAPALPSQVLQSRLHERFLEAGRVPVVEVSALQGQGVDDIMPAALAAYNAWNTRCGATPPPPLRQPRPHWNGGRRSPVGALSAPSLARPPHHTRALAHARGHAPPPCSPLLLTCRSPLLQKTRSACDHDPWVFALFPPPTLQCLLSTAPG